MAGEPAFLDVETSALGRRWVGPSSADSRLAAGLAQQTGLPQVVALMLARAGVSAASAQDYLAPTLRALLPDPSSLKDMDRATALMMAHIARGDRVAIFGDYDVDGAASSALIFDWLSAIGPPPTVYIPDRIDEGYGPNDAAMTQLAQNHPLIICVDCGTLSHGPIAAARAAGAQVIVLDHHLGPAELPEAGAVVNPNRQDEDGAHAILCAAGVVFLFLVSLNRARRAAGQSEPPLLPLLDLVALATVADVAALQGLNRALVRQGLTVMGQRNRPGLVALADVAGLRSAPAAYHLGFLLGPRINAGGRVGQADLGARLLTTRDPTEATALAAQLDALNTERRTIEAEVQAQAIAQAEARGTDGPLVWAAGEGWHPGVVGIVAARMKEAFNRPAIVIGLNGETGQGSGRSVTGVDLGAAIARCATEGLLIKGGGHKMAAGLTVAVDQLEPAMERLGALLARQGAGSAGPADLRIDALLSAAGATPELIETLETAGPFGTGAPQPRFAFSGVSVVQARVVGEAHVSLTLRDSTGSLGAIAFRAADGPLAPLLLTPGRTPLHVAGRIEIDDWGGRRKVKLRIEDAAALSHSV